MMNKTVYIVILFLFLAGTLSAQEQYRPQEKGPFKTSVTQGFSPIVQADAGAVPSAGEQLSPGKAFMFSLLLPGAGEYYAGSKKMALTFLGSEVLLWSAYFTSRTLGRWKQEDAVTWAASHAGIDLKGRDHAFYVAVENYNNIRDYNNAKLQQRDVAALYPEDSEHSWQWDSEASRAQFEKTRVNSDAWYNGSKFIVAGVILNHLISGIDAIRIVKQKNRVRVGVVGLPEGGFVFMATRSF